jgi:hypothetical protein
MSTIAHLNELLQIIRIQIKRYLLVRNSAKDEHWQIANYTIGDLDGETSINISGNSLCCSILEILPLHLGNENIAGYLTFWS